MSFAEGLPDDHTVAEGDRPAHLPPLLNQGGELAPKAPTDPREAEISPATLRDLALKTAYTVSLFTTEWAARQLGLPQALLVDKDFGDTVEVTVSTTWTPIMFYVFRTQIVTLSATSIMPIAH